MPNYAGDPERQEFQINPRWTESEVKAGAGIVVERSKKDEIASRIRPRPMEYAIPKKKQGPGIDRPVF